MSIGTGLFVLGAWLVWVAAFASPAVNQRGVDMARRAVVIATLIALGITAATHPAFLAAVSVQ